MTLYAWMQLWKVKPSPFSSSHTTAGSLSLAAVPFRTSSDVLEVANERLESEPELMTEGNEGKAVPDEVA